MKVLSAVQALLILVFTIVETVALTVWLIALGVVATGNQTTAAIVLFVGLFIEHTIAIIAGNYPEQGAVIPQRDQQVSTRTWMGGIKQPRAIPAIFSKKHARIYSHPSEYHLGTDDSGDPHANTSPLGPEATQEKTEARTAQ